MFEDRKRQIVFPEAEKPVRFFFSIFVNAEINLRCLAVDVPGNFTGRIKSFSIRQIIYQLGKVFCHVICIFSRGMLIF